MLPFTVNNFFYMTSFSTPNASALKKPRLQKAGLAWLEERLKTKIAAESFYAANNVSVPPTCQHLSMILIPDTVWEYCC